MQVTPLLFLISITVSLCAMDNEHADYTKAVTRIIALENMEQTPLVKRLRNAYLSRLPLADKDQFEKECLTHRIEQTSSIVIKQINMLKGLEETFSQGAEGISLLSSVEFFLRKYSAMQEICSRVIAHEKESRQDRGSVISIQDMVDVHAGIFDKLQEIDQEVITFLERVAIDFITNIVKSSAVKQTLKILRENSSEEVPTSQLFKKYVYLFSKKNLFDRSEKNLKRIQTCLDFYKPGNGLISNKDIQIAHSYNLQATRFVCENERCDERQLKNLQNLTEELTASPFQAREIAKRMEKEKENLEGLARIVEKTTYSLPSFLTQIRQTVLALDFFIATEVNKLPLPRSLPEMIKTIELLDKKIAQIEPHSYRQPTEEAYDAIQNQAINEKLHPQ